MSQNGQTHFKNLAAFASRFLKCVRPIWDIIWDIKALKSKKICKYQNYFQLIVLDPRTGQPALQ